MLDIILGNAYSLGATLADAYSGTRKTKKGILIIQSISQLFYIASAMSLNAYSAAAQNVVSIFRNLYGAFDKNNKFWDWFFIVSPVILGFYFNNQGWLGIIPIVANLEYALAMFIFSDNPTTLKWAFVLCNVLFAFFNFIILNFVGGVSCIVIALITGISAYKEDRAGKKS